ncbi:hypothetical protein CerSpe_268620 [Prunus speciosa]
MSSLVGYQQLNPFLRRIKRKPAAEQQPDWSPQVLSNGRYKSVHHRAVTNKVEPRWVYQAGATLAVKSYNKERIKQNLQVFDWELTEDDLDKINQIPQHKMMMREELVSADGSSSPYKSLEEVWDGEI